MEIREMKKNHRDEVGEWIYAILLFIAGLGYILIYFGVPICVLYIAFHFIRKFW
jgi:hypothetical protein